MLKFNFRKGYLITLITLIMIFAMTSVAFGSSSYDTKSFNVKIDVRENNVYEITEEITVDFHGYNHGIYRNIPENFGKMKLKDIEVEGYESEIFNEDGNEVIRIGSEDVKVTGVKKYVINYKMEIADDKNPKGDFFYLDLIPTNWETSIGSASVTVNMPKTLDWDNLKVYAGQYGQSGITERVKFKVEPDSNSLKIYGKNLKKGTGITAKIELEEGYWVNPYNYDYAKDWLIWPMIVIPIILLLMWFLFGRDPKIVKTVEFYPPEDMTPAEIGYIVDGAVDKKDMVSLILYFAEKGYLKIEEPVKDGSEGKSEAIKLIKVRDIDETEKNFAQIFFSGLFYKGREEVYIDKLDEHFAGKYNTSKAVLTNTFDTKKKSIFSSSSRVARFIGIFLMIIPVGAAMIASALVSMYFDLLFIAIPVAILLVFGLVTALVAYDRKLSTSNKKFKNKFMLGILFSSLAVVITSAIVVISVDGWMQALLLIASYVISLVCVLFMKARSKSTIETIGKILGFREFIEKAEIPKLEKLVDDDPTYFYSVLPYAYAMGLSEKWAEHFKNIPTASPDWYYGGTGVNAFDIIWFSTRMSMINSTFANSITVSTLDSGIENGGFGSGGGSFGGFSGGGFGGGGGGAW